MSPGLAAIVIKSTWLIVWLIGVFFDLARVALRSTSLAAVLPLRPRPAFGAILFMDIVRAVETEVLGDAKVKDVQTDLQGHG